MSLFGSIPPIAASALQRIDAPLPKIGLPPVAAPGTTPLQGFGQLLDSVVATVDTKQQTASALTRQVLTGESDQMHQSIIAMQEAGVAFSMMVEVRNKLVESYQELMRMQA
jgi:flagellar hook-basal body complex protein FliE